MCLSQICREDSNPHKAEKLLGPKPSVVPIQLRQNVIVGMVGLEPTMEILGPKPSGIAANLHSEFFNETKSIDN